MINPKLFIPNKSKIVYSICGIQVDVDAAIRPTYLFASGIYDKIILGQLRQLGIHRKKKRQLGSFMNLVSHIFGSLSIYHHK
jgi:hypothetical protein